MPHMIVAFRAAPTARPRPHFAGIGRTPQWGPRQFGRLVGWLAGRWRTARAQSAAAGELAAMSDAELADMSINRCDTRRVFDPSFRQDDPRRGKSQQRRW